MGAVVDSPAYSVDLGALRNKKIQNGFIVQNVSFHRDGWRRENLGRIKNCGRQIFLVGWNLLIRYSKQCAIVGHTQENFPTKTVKESPYGFVDIFTEPFLAGFEFHAVVFAL